MNGWWKKFVLILLLVIPLQGLAATLSTLSCFSAEERATTPSHAYIHHDGPSHQHEGDGSKDNSGHPCCNHFFSAVPAVAATAAPSELSAFESALSLLTTLFVPERPQRPPRS